MPEEETPVDDLSALESGGEEEAGDDAWWKPPKEPLSDNSVVMHRFDHEALGNGMAEAPEFEKEVSEAEEKWATVEKLAEDLFGSMFRFDPTVRETGEITPQYRPNRDMVQQAMGTNEYTELRQYTMGDPLTSLIATKTILEKLLESVPEPVKQAQNQCAEAQGELQKLAQQMQALQQAMAQAQGTTKQGLQGQANAVNQRAQAAQNQAAQAQQNLQKAMQDNAASVRFACRQGIKAAQGEEEETRNLLGGWGMGSGTEQRLSPKERIELAKKLKQNQKLRRVTQVLGKFRRLALSKQRSKLNRNPDKVTSITVGNDLAQVIPSELVALDDEDLEVDFLRRYAEHQLLQYKLEGEEKV
ncbi:MAG: hypothetical protein KGJ69_04945, partial [Thermoplasmata archaeon]|nr:hypothetical protein [Thermoplasmata archaeon]